MTKTAFRNASILACALAIGIAVAPRTAFADPSAAETSVARDHFKEGMEAGKAGRWEEARAAFQRSYDVWPRPLTLLNLAGAQAESGKLVLASESYRKFVREASAPGADPKAVEQKAAAQQSLASIEARLPRVRIRVDGQQEGDTVEMDGQPLSNGMLGVYFPADPQEHRLAVTRGGAQVATTTFRLQEKETKDVALAAPPPATPAGSAGSRPESPAWFKPTPAQPRPAEQPSSGGSIFSSPWFWGITGVVVAAGAVTGVVLATSSSGADAPAPYTGNVPPTRIVLR
jgi:hypothetical protein